MSDNESSANSKKQDRELILDKVVKKELNRIPEAVRDQFLLNLEMVRLGLQPAMASEKLHAAGDGVIELKVNGSPAYRCMYVVRRDGNVVVLHVTAKTSQGQSKQLVKTTSQRLKRLG